MSDGGIDRDHEIELLDEARCVGKIVDMVAEVSHKRCRAAGDQIRRTRSFLQRVKVDAGFLQQAQKGFDAGAAVLIVLVRRLPGPADADREVGAIRTQAASAFRHHQIGKIGGDGFERRAEQARQAEQWRMPAGSNPPGR